MTTDTENGNSDQGNLAAGGAEAIRGQTSRTASGVPPSAAEWLSGHHGAASSDWREGWDACRNRCMTLRDEANAAASPSADKAEPEWLAKAMAAKSLLIHAVQRLHSNGTAQAMKDADDAMDKILRAAVPPTALLREVMEALKVGWVYANNAAGGQLDADTIHAAIAALGELVGEKK